MKKPQLIAGLELGTRHFTAAVGELQEKNRLVIRAVDSVPAQGFEKEGLSDPIECSDAVARLIRQLERSLSGRVAVATAAFPATHLKSFNADASIPVSDAGSGITRQDVDKVVSTCRSLSVDYDRQILHSFERSFTVDGQPGVRNPVGLSGKKLTVDLHLVTAQTHTVQNLAKVLNRAGLEPGGFVLPSLGVSEAVLTDLDRDLGVTLIRIGEFQTEVILFDDGHVRETFLLPGGLEDLIENIGRVFKLARVSAEHLLEQVRTLEEHPAVVGPDGAPIPASSDWADVPLRAGVGAAVRTFPQGQVVQLVRHRAKELLNRIQRRLVASPLFLDCASGIVIVGPMARLEGFLEMAEELFNMPVRLGTVKDLELAPGLELRAQDTTAVGLVRYHFRLRAIVEQNGAMPPWLKPLEKFQRLLQEYF